MFCRESRRAIIYSGTNAKQGITVMQMQEKEKEKGGGFIRIFRLDDVKAKYFVLDYRHVLKASREPWGKIEVYHTDGKKIYEIQVREHSLW